MTSPLNDKHLQRCHAAFGRDHERLRAELVAELAVRRADETSAPRRAVKPGPVVLRWWAPVAAAAAVVAIVGGTLWLGVTDAPRGDTLQRVVAPVTDMITPQSAWANALAQARQVQSLHMIMSTPRRDGSGASVEVWWRRPHDFRMEFDTGLTTTGNAVQRCTWDVNSQTLTIRDATGPGFEMAILGEVGQMFASDYALGSEWSTEAEVVAVEDVSYRGETCRRITLQSEDGRYEYIVDKHTSMIYEGTRYSQAENGRVLSRMEVISVDSEMPDSLFVIEPEPGVVVNDQLSARPSW